MGWYVDGEAPYKQTAQQWMQVTEWKNDFKGYVNALDLPRDDYKGIMAYIDELPSVQQEPCREETEDERGVQ